MPEVILNHDSFSVTIGAGGDIKGEVLIEQYKDEGNDRNLHEIRLDAEDTLALFQFLKNNIEGIDKHE